MRVYNCMLWLFCIEHHAHLQMVSSLLGKHSQKVVTGRNGSFRILLL